MGEREAQGEAWVGEREAHGEGWAWEGERPKGRGVRSLLPRM